jgi:hypothetical protein
MTSLSNKTFNSSDWMKMIAQEGCHTFFVGNPDRLILRLGRVSILNNFIELLKQQSRELEVIIFDPKYPFTYYSGIKPKYKGIQGSIEGLKVLDDELETRFKLATQDADADKPIREFPNQLYLINDLELLEEVNSNLDNSVHEYLTDLGIGNRKPVTRILKKAFARSNLGISVICLAQSTSTLFYLSLNQNDINQPQVASLYFGEMIPQVIHKTVIYQKDNLLEAFNQIQQRQETLPVLVKISCYSPFIAEITSESFNQVLQT